MVAYISCYLPLSFEVSGSATDCNDLAQDLKMCRIRISPIIGGFSIYMHDVPPIIDDFPIERILRSEIGEV